MEKITDERMRPIRDEIYLRIRKDILRGAYQPGDRLQEEQLAGELGTSRTPVREALRKLEVERMVVHYPHRGVVVSEISMDEMEELYEIRTLAEALIAKRAARNATPKDVKRLYKLVEEEESATNPEEILDAIDAYNAAIAEIADCPSLSDISSKVRELLSRMILSGHLRPMRRPLAQREHREIVAAIANNDTDLAYTLTLQHIQKASQVLSPAAGPDERKAEESFR